MTEKLKEVVLLEGENILFQIEGNAYTESPNPLVKLLASFTRLIGKLLGHSLRTYIVVTDKRVIRVDKEKSFWVIPKNTVVLTLTKSSIKEVGYAQAVRWLFVKTLYFQLQTLTENTKIAYTGSLEEVNKIVLKVSEIIST